MHAHPVPAPIRTTANDRLKQRSPIVTAHGVMVAVAVHFAVFALFPMLSAADIGSVTAEDIEILTLPDEIPIPPAPERIQRPMNPVISDVAPPEETIGVTRFDEWRAADLMPPPPVVGRDVADAPVWVPHTVEPRLLNQAEVQRALVRDYPPNLRDAGVGGTTTVWLLVSEEGSVLQTRVAESSERPQLDAAALGVAQVMRFAPALNRSRAVQVWVALPIRFEARTPRP